MVYINTKKMEEINLKSNNYAVIIDFDRTITSKESADSWDASGHLLGDEFQNELEKLYKFYAPIETNYSISIDRRLKYMENWYSKCMDLYCQYGLTKEKLTQSIKSSKIIFRTGAKEFLNKMKANNIPVIILSAGIGNVIEQFLLDNNCLYDNTYIISNFIEFNQDATMKKFDNTKMIHTLNKTMIGHLPEIWQQKLENKKYRLLLGDLIDDTNMVEKQDWNKTIKVGFLNKRIDENLHIYNNTFDLVFTNEDATFNKVEELI